MIKFVSYLRQVRGYFPGIPVSFANKTDRQDITEILLKVALNTITLTRPLLSRSLPIFYGEILRDSDCNLTMIQTPIERTE